MSRVDVIVPCYNYGRFLRECVESVLTQPVEVRVLIIDDASTDDTPEVAATLAAEDARIEFRRHAVNRGHIATYNEGLEWISGDYTLLISADDLLAPGALLHACEFMDANPGVGFVYGKLIRWTSGEPKPTHPSTTDANVWLITPGVEWIEHVCRKGPPTTSPEILVRTDLQRRLGAYRPELPHWADVEMLLRFAAHGSVGYTQNTQAYYRIHENNMHNLYNGLRELEQRRATFQFFFDTYSQLLIGASALRTLARRQVAELAVHDAYVAFEKNDIEYCNSCLKFSKFTFSYISKFKCYRIMLVKLAIGPKWWARIRPYLKKINYIYKI